MWKKKSNDTDNLERQGPIEREKWINSGSKSIRPFSKTGREGKVNLTKYSGFFYRQIN